jgi:hypothetical protein
MLPSGIETFHRYGDATVEELGHGLHRTGEFYHASPSGTSADAGQDGFG